MPLFWFVNSTNGIKRIRDKTFCFVVRLRPNLRTWQTTCIHGTGCNPIELRGIRMSEFPPLLLRKRATTSPLSQNLFCQLQAKGEWLIILESLKRKNKQGQRPQPSNKQTRCFERKATHTREILYLITKDTFHISYLLNHISCVHLILKEK